MEIQGSKYRWKILIAMMLGISSLNFAILLVPSMAATIIGQFGLTQVQFATIASISFLAGFIFGIPSGTLADRYGVKLVIVVGLAISLLGAILRINAATYGALALCNFLIGVGVATIDANAAKYLSMWFKPEEMGTAMGMFVSSTGVGTGLAFATGNLYPTYKIAFTVAVAWIAIGLIAWFLMAKKVEMPQGFKPEPMSKHLGVCFKSKNLMISTLSIFLILGATLVINSFLTQALIVEKGLEPVHAGLISTMLNVCLIIGGFVSGLIVSKIGKLKPVLVTICIVCGACYYLAWIMPFGTLTYLILILAGLTAGGTIPVAKTMVPMISITGDFGPESIGTAGGIHSAAQNLGAFIIPTYIVAGIAGQDFQMSFAIGFGIFVLAGLLNLLIPELGPNGSLQQGLKQGN